MRLNHRLRLAVASSAASGAVLGLLFVAIVLYVRQNVYQDLSAELHEAMRNFTLDPQRPFDASKFDEAYPSYEVKREPRVPSPLVAGEVRRIDDHVYLAAPFRGEVLVMSADWRPQKKSIRRLAMVLAPLWPLLTLLVGVASWLAARAVFRPLERLTSQAATFAGESLSERLHTDDPHEFGEFAASLNEMLDRIEREVRRGDRFAADAAHELRTPLAILRTRMDTALLKPRSPEEYQETIRLARGEIVRLTDIAQALLRTARGETSAAGPLSLKPVVQTVAAEWLDRLAERGVGLELHLDDAVAILTEEEAHMVLDNLLDNALRFAPSGTPVTVRLETGDTVDLSVIDHGPGFPRDLGERAFDRFVRGDDSRNRDSGGAGIGLSIVRRIADSRGGRAFHQETPGGGATVVVRLPKVANPSPGQGAI